MELVVTNFAIKQRQNTFISYHIINCRSYVYFRWKISILRPIFVVSTWINDIEEHYFRSLNFLSFYELLIINFHSRTDDDVAPNDADGLMNSVCSKYLSFIAFLYFPPLSLIFHLIFHRSSSRTILCVVSHRCWWTY